MTTYCQKQSSAYKAVVKQIDGLLALPYACRSDFWWQEEFARLQQSRDAILPPKDDGHVRERERRQAKRKHKRVQDLGVTHLSRVGRLRQLGLTDEMIQHVLSDL